MALGAKVISVEESPYDAIDIIPDSDIYGEYRIKTNKSPLLLRTKPDGDVICEMPKGRTVSCYGFTDESGDWYLCEYSAEGKVYAGFCHKKYLEKKGE